MGDVESKLGSIGKTKEELNGVQVKHLNGKNTKHVLSAIIDDCNDINNDDDDDGGDNAHLTLERGQNLYLKSNQDYT